MSPYIGLKLLFPELGTLLGYLALWLPDRSMAKFIQVQNYHSAALSVVFRAFDAHSVAAASNVNLQREQVASMQSLQPVGFHFSA